MIDERFWKNKRVLVTGHTGFKGGWLSLWLYQLGAVVSGFSLAPDDDSAFYSNVYCNGFVGDETIADIANYEELSECLESFKPEIIFHLAAQPIVRSSYQNPVHTFLTNAVGTLNLYEVVRTLRQPCVIVNITTDKVYKNNEWIWAYRENEKLGGSDPYSASKACAEIISMSYVDSYFSDLSVKSANVRAGNVIGGGDMSVDRLIPDYFRALTENRKMVIRNPLATRPWQHVLEPLSGYLMLAEKLFCSDSDKYVGAWNFGPTGDPIPVGAVIDELSNIAKGPGYKLDSGANPHEAQALMLDSAKSRNLIGWKPKLNIKEALTLTFNWFESSRKGIDMHEYSIDQIKSYQNDDPLC